MREKFIKPPINILLGETLATIPTKTPKVSQFIGIARVESILKGDDFDIVNMRFSFIDGIKTRPVFVFTNFARRQELTLKMMQYCFVGGVAKRVRDPIPEGEDFRKYPLKWRLYAYVIDGKYVPKMFDFKRHIEEVESGEEKEQMTPMSDKAENYFKEIALDILNNGVVSEGDEYEEIRKFEKD